MAVQERENMKKSLVVGELLRLTKSHGGKLKPQDVVAAARFKTSPLHSCFDWKDTEAARKWRLHQARNLLLVTVDVIQKKTTRMFVSLKTERKQGYRLVAQVLSHKEQREQMLVDAYEDLRSFQKKYATLSELSKVFTAITEVLQKKVA